MNKIVHCIIFCCIISISSKANFDIWGSAVCLNINGTNGFYNTQKLTGPFAIGNNNFNSILGVFGKNSAALKIIGAEINISKSNNSTVCIGRFFYTVYKQGNRPTAPVFSNFNLDIYCNCNGSVFSNCGGRACNASSDQKLQNVNQNIDLTNLETGDYIIEVYYQANGDNLGNNCTQQVLDNAGNDNYKARFSITTPLALNIVFLNGISTNDGITIKWVVQNDADILKYEVQKSENGFTFNTIQTINSFQNIANSTYLYNDDNPLIGTNYYRIKSFNSNGIVNLSTVFRIYFGKVGNTIFIYPNPTDKELTIRFAAVKKGNYQMSVLSTFGQLLVTMPIYHDGVDKTVKMTLPAILAKGIYRLFLIDKLQFYKQSFLVK